MLRKYSSVFVIFLVALALFLTARHIALKGAEEGYELAWDEGWYSWIISNGYSFNGDYTAAQTPNFFPMYPMLCRVVKKTFGLPDYLAMLLTSSLSTLFALIFLWKLLCKYFNEHVATKAVALYALNPFALCFFNGYTESLWSLCIILFFYLLLVKEHFLGAVLIVAVASATRSYGILLVVIFILQMLARHHAEYRWKATVHSRYLQALALHTPLGFLGLAGYTIFLWRNFNDPLAFSHLVYYAYDWGGGSFQEAQLSDVRAVAANMYYTLPEIFTLNSVAIGILLFVLAWLVLALCVKKIPPIFTAFALMLLIFFYFMEVQVRGAIAISLGRYMVVLFPCALALALLLGRHQPQNSGKPVKDFLSCYSVGFFVVVLMFGMLLFKFTMDCYLSRWVS